MSGTFRSFPRYPAVLGARIAQADQLARALQSLSGKSVASDRSFLWLLGRAEDVRAFVDGIVREWSGGVVDTTEACEAIRSYVGATHIALHRRYGGYGASCCGPHLESFAAPRAGAVGAMRQRFKSGEIEVGAPDGPPSQVRPRPRELVERHGHAVASRRRQAG